MSKSQMSALSRAFDASKGQQFQIMDPKGKIVNADYLPKLSKKQLVEAFEWMLKVRIIDERILSFQRQGRILTYPLNKGQEAAQMGSVLPLKSEDWVAPSYREMGVWLCKGQTLRQYFQYWNGMEEGFRLDEGVNLLPCCIPIASQNQHAVGIAMAANYKNESCVAVAYTGDGGTSQGDFHESMNFASVFKAPVIFFVTNNQYAISLPVAKQQAAKTIAQRAVAYDIPGIQVDGNDFFAVYKVMTEAIAHAKSGQGPVLIEALTYRLEAHTTSDDPSLYRTDEEVKQWIKKDPIDRLRAYLKSEKIWTEKSEASFRAILEKEIDDTFQEVEKNTDVPVEDLFRYHFKEMPTHLQNELAEYQAFINRKV